MTSKVAELIIIGMCNHYINKFEYTCGISEMYSRDIRSDSQ